jgi:peptidoglycan/LPS O-acetylase OafA/YrhL
VLERPRFHVLDGYRGIAAFAVLLFHIIPTGAAQLAQNGALAVDFFFMLSGFVLAAAYGDRLAGSLSVAGFMRIRLMRLYPLIVLGAVIGAACFAPLYDHRTVAAWFLTGLLLLPSPIGAADGGQLIAINPVSWSLMWELVANLAYAWLMPRLSNRMLALIVAISLAALIGVSVTQGTLDLGSQWSAGWGGAPRVSFAFFAGVGLYRMWRAGVRPHIVSPLAGACILWLTFLAPHASPVTPLLDLAAVAVCFPLIILNGASGQAGRWAPWCAVAATISYPLYILQGGLDPYLNIATARTGLTGWPETLVGLAIAAGYCGFAALAARFYDEPIQRALRSLGSRQRNGSRVQRLAR